jgi:hypothetical protein
MAKWASKPLFFAGGSRDMGLFSAIRHHGAAHRTVSLAYRRGAGGCGNSTLSEICAKQQLIITMKEVCKGRENSKADGAGSLNNYRYG